MDLSTSLTVDFMAAHTQDRVDACIVWLVPDVAAFQAAFPVIAEVLD
ncbi:MULTISPECIES: hypothetical protein [Pseudomonadota]|nr:MULTISPECIES: hypothetical protein [Pseudomonadota]